MTSIISFFDTWRKVLVENGFVEVDASIIEHSELYITKSGEELGSRQLYSFTDKGERQVALRPEMTPTIARMVAARYGQLSFPLRWFCIPNCFRYERPQKGRLREFWQLNADIIGLEAGPADLELLILLARIFTIFGAGRKTYTIRYNHRQVLDNWIDDVLKVEQESKPKVYSLLDSWRKLSDSQRDEQTNSFLNEIQITYLNELIIQSGAGYDSYLKMCNNHDELRLIFSTLSEICPETDFIFDPTIVRGIAYYTGLVVEAFDNNPTNPRALFGGGRYDNLLDIFGESAHAIGFGLGDVTMSEFLTGWDLWPEHIKNNRQLVNKIGILVLNESEIPNIFTKIIPEIIASGATFDIDYDVLRNENKRYTKLKKRGCNEVLKI